MRSFILTIFLVLFTGVILALSLRGHLGNPNSTELNAPNWIQEGPFELSPERGRFALTYSIVKDKSLFFSVPVARFATPDLGYVHGRYVSLFAPAISYLVIPGFIIGSMLGASQVGAFAIISIFAILNLLLIRAIAIRLGSNPLAATIGGLVFVFATPAYNYAITLYQHHVSTFLILLSIYILLRFRGLWSLFIIWFLLAASIPVDYPNLFLMLPIAMYATGRIIIIQVKEKGFDIKIKLPGILTFITVILPLAFFLWFNNASYGNPFQFSGTISGARAIDSNGKPIKYVTPGTNNAEKALNAEIEHKSAIKFFEPRNFINGLYLHLFSPDRGILIYTPVMLFGLPGFIFLYRKNRDLTVVFLGIILADLLLYSMWGDPWGGWAFGSRYMIPSYAVISVLAAIALSRLNKNILFLGFFLIIFSYSAVVNTAGALTSSANPPQAEVLALEKLSGHQEKYTYERNLDSLRLNKSKSFLYQSWAHKYVNAWKYFLIIAFAIIIIMSVLTVSLGFIKARKN